MRESAQSNSEDLRRGVVVNAVGYLFKPLLPLLLLLVIRQHGATAFGVFVVCESLLILGQRICLLGFDGGLLWWVSKQPPALQRSQFRPVALLVSALTLVFAGVALWFPTIAGSLLSMLGGKSSALSLELQTTMQWMLLGLTPMTLSELLAASLAGRRQLQARVYVLTGVVPLSFSVLALALSLLPVEQPMLALAFLGSHLVGFACCSVMYLREFKRVPKLASTAWLPKAELVRFSGPLWLSQLGGVMLARIDVMMLTVFGADLAAIGVYAVARKISFVVRELRHAIAPVLTSIAARASSRDDHSELAQSFSYTTFLVLTAQVPVYAVIWLLGDWILELHGAGFASQWGVLMILASAWLAGGLLGNASSVVIGFGRSKLLLLNVAVGITIQAVGHWLLIPVWGVNGAASAVAISWLVMFALANFEMRGITGRWNYQRLAIRPLILGGIAAAFSLATAHLIELPATFNRFAPVLAFATVYGAGIWRLYQQGVLAGPTDKKPQQPKTEMAAAA